MIALEYEPSKAMWELLRWGFFESNSNLICVSHESPLWPAKHECSLRSFYLICCLVSFGYRCLIVYDNVQRHKNGHTKKGKTQIDKWKKKVLWKSFSFFDLKSSHFKEGCFHVGTQELVFVFFAADSVCKLDESVNRLKSFSFNTQNFFAILML